MVQSWMVIVDGSDISQKTVEVAASFLTNEDGEDDEFAVVHGFDPSIEQPPHKQPSHISAIFESLVAKAKTHYEVTGPQPLIASVTAVQSKPGSGEVGLRQAFLDHSETVVKPDMVFIGSFGAGGTRIDENGTMSDGIARLARCSVAIVKNTWPVPDFKAGAKFTVACDGGPSSLESAWLVRRLIKPHDIMECVIVCHHETDKEREWAERLKIKLASARPKAEQAKATIKIITSESTSKEAIARTLCSFAQRSDSDFLVTGSQGHSGAQRRGRGPGPAFGEVTAICANISRTHFIVMKPEFVFSSAPVGGPPRMVKRSSSFLGKMPAMGGQEI